MSKIDASDHAWHLVPQDFGKFDDLPLDANIFVATPDPVNPNPPEAPYISPEQAENYDEFFQQLNVPQHNATVPPSQPNSLPSIPRLPPPPIPVRSSAGLLRDLPSYNYTLPPGGPINFTLVEIISLLPNWFRNSEIAIRFLNNHITASIHLAILQEHRDLGISTEYGKARAREAIADTYRRTMRAIDPSWTKAKHITPQTWNDGFMSVNAFLPDAARERSYRRSPSVAFKRLLDGVKKLPQGVDAGDLTRAIEYACNAMKFDEDGQRYELLFPDDIQMILDYTGRTYITMEHTDRHAVRKYVDKARAATGQNTRVQKMANSTSVQPAVRLNGDQRVHSVSNLLRIPQQNPPDVLNYPPLAPIVPYSTIQPSTPSIMAVPVNKLFKSVPSAEVEAWIIAPGDKIDHYTSKPEVHHNESTTDRFRNEVADLKDLHKEYATKSSDYLLTPSPSPESKHSRTLKLGDYKTPKNDNHELPASKSKECRHYYSPDQLLRDCPEGLWADDGSDLVRAARYAQEHDQIGTDWIVQDIDLILALVSLDGMEQ